MQQPPKSLIDTAPAGTAWCGGSVDLSRVVLRVMPTKRGDPIDIDAVASVLQCEPDQKHRTKWSLRAPDSEMADLDAQVSWILERVSSNVEVWDYLRKNYRIDLFCGLYLYAKNRGVALSSSSMMELGRRGIEIGFDIYMDEKD